MDELKICVIGMSSILTPSYKNLPDNVVYSGYLVYVEFSKAMFTLIYILILYILVYISIYTFDI